MSNQTITLVVDVTCAPGKRDQVKAALDICTQASRNEPGCLRYQVFLDGESKEKITLVEEWQNQQAIDAHNASEHFIALQDSLQGLVAEVNLKSLQEVSLS